MKIIRVGVDIAKSVFQVHAVDHDEKPVWRRKLSRDTWIKELCEKVEPGRVIAMEACGGAHHWARTLEAKGYTVRLMAPQFVKPYVRMTPTMPRPSVRRYLARTCGLYRSKASSSKTFKRCTAYVQN